jgi:hypothetical protein
MKYQLLILFTAFFCSYGASQSTENKDEGQGLGFFREGAVGILGKSSNEDQSTIPTADIETLSYEVWELSPPLNLSLRHSLNVLSFNLSSDNNIQRTIVESIGAELITQSGGTFYFALDRTWFDQKDKNKTDWYIKGELNGGVLPFAAGVIDSTLKENTVGLWRGNIFIDTALEVEIPVKNKKKKDAVPKPVYFTANALLGLSHIFANDDHVFYTMFQDSRGNRANPTGFTYNLEASLKISQNFRITVGALGRISFGDGIQDGDIFGLKPRTYLSVDSAF